jgi:7,8-dihydropterin-6-yl-methyl-4-(beta-D-ribofuranosyl)aminobenzene 5'-phosphate synthase
MKLTVLVDNQTFIDHYFLGEPALSYLIELDGKKILWDVGYSDVFLSNAVKMGQSLLDLDVVALSHGHLDHTWGLETLVRLYTEAQFEKRQFKRPQLVMHPGALDPRTFHGSDEFGSMLSEGILRKYFDLVLADVPVWLTDDLVFLGQVERTNGFEAQKPIGKIGEDDRLEDDYMLDDTALAYRSPQGLVIITGCSHSGICNITEYARRITGEERVIDVIGGFHLIQPIKEQLVGTLDYFAALQPERLHACHCTDLGSKIALSKVAPIREVGVGLVLEYA